MQSSAAVTLRALVMLLCLILVPLTAVFGTSLPKVVTSILNGRGIPAAARGATETPETRPDAGEAPAFGTVQVPGAGADFVSPGDPQAASAAPPWNGVPASDLRPTGSLEGHSTGAPPPLVAPSSASPPQPSTRLSTSAGSEAFQQLERRLRELGATYYLLETWGTSGQLYRFHCKMAIAGNPNYTRHFEATESEPIRAMRLVLDQVEQWRASAPR